MGMLTTFWLNDVTQWSATIHRVGFASSGAAVAGARPISLQMVRVKLDE